MKKLINLTFSLSLFLTCAFGQSPLLDKTWAPVCRIMDDGERIDVNFRLFLTFRQDSVTVSSFGRTGQTFHYALDLDSSLSIKLFETAKLRAVSESELVIDFGDETVVFASCSGRGQFSGNELLSVLKGKEWEFINSNIDERYLVLDSAVSGYLSLREGVEDVFSMERIDVFQNEIRCDLGFWSAKEVDGHVFILLDNVFGMDDFKIIRVEDVEVGKIRGRSWFLGEEEEVVFSALPKLSEDERSTFNAHLTRSEWRLFEAKMDSVSHGGSRSVDDYHKSLDTTLLLTKLSFESNDLSYKFELDGGFAAFIAGKLAFEGTWSVLMAGKIIKLKEKWRAEERWEQANDLEHRTRDRYVFIKALSEDELHFVREEYLYVGSGAYEITYVEQRYRR